MNLKTIKSPIFSLIFTVLLLSIVFYLSWLNSFIKSPKIIIYTIGAIVIIGIFQSLLVWYAISPAKEKLLEERLNQIQKTTESLSLSAELRKEGNIMSSLTFQENEGKMKEVWVVLEDLAIFDKDDGGFFKFNIENTRKGVNYIYFTSNTCKQSVKAYANRIPKAILKKNDEDQDEIKIGKGTIKFVYVDPKAFLFVSPITIWNPYNDEDAEKNRKVFLDFPKYPAGYHLVVEDDLANKIFNRLVELIPKSK